MTLKSSLPLHQKRPAKILFRPPMNENSYFTNYFQYLINNELIKMQEFGVKYPNAPERFSAKRRDINQ